ncbi:MAG: ribbon-helix-helix protein, CopG family [Actinobacteria bacterium]|jgi:metal-responsive CopG/Arc/MetJ family transcriptional regulator|nr:ribbon-helix-helix protein, CopG family [Actinomycetota bacterium]MBU4313577.1 ribbon-helix-helix protein, CopG family [Actinomycetota bacterium]
MVRINLSIDEKELQELDNIRKKENLSRSKLIREAIQLYKRKFNKIDLENRRIEKIKNAIRIQDSLRKYSRDWDGVSEIRKWREAR